MSQFKIQDATPKRDPSGRDLETRELEFGGVCAKYMYRWSLSFIFLAFIISNISIPFGDISFIQMLAKTTPAINKWAEAARYKDMTVILWIYMTFLIPLLVFKLVFFTNHKKPLENPIKFFLFSTGMFLFVVFPFVDGTVFGFEFLVSSQYSSFQSQFYLETRVGIVFISWMMGILFMVFTSLYFNFLIEIFNLRNRFKLNNGE